MIASVEAAISFGFRKNDQWICHSPHVSFEQFDGHRLGLNILLPTIKSGVEHQRFSDVHIGEIEGSTLGMHIPQIFKGTQLVKIVLSLAHFTLTVLDQHEATKRPYMHVWVSGAPCQMQRLKVVLRGKGEIAATGCGITYERSQQGSHHPLAGNVIIPDTIEPAVQIAGQAMSFGEVAEHSFGSHKRAFREDHRNRIRILKQASHGLAASSHSLPLSIHSESGIILIGKEPKTI